jgi:hypothetical protein
MMQERPSLAIQVALPLTPSPYPSHIHLDSTRTQQRQQQQQLLKQEEMRRVLTSVLPRLPLLVVLCLVVSAMSPELIEA